MQFTSSYLATYTEARLVFFSGEDRVKHDTLMSMTHESQKRSSAFLSLSALGLITGILFFSASLTPSLVPRSPVIQGALSGLSYSVGYAVGLLIEKLLRIIHAAPRL